MADVRIVQGGQNQGPIVAADVRALLRANAQVFVQVNASGDIVNPGGAGGVGSNVNISQINGQTPAMNAGNADSGTLRVVVASDQGTIPVSGSFTATTTPPPVTGVQVVGGSIGARISASGDLNVIPSTTNFSRFPVSGDQALVDGSNVAIRATVKQYLRSNPLSVVLVNASGDAYNASGGGAASNVNINQVGGTSTAVNAGTADNGTQRVIIASDQGTIPVSGSFTSSPPPVTGVQIVGGSVGAQVTPSGDFPVRIASSTTSLGVTGDVSTKPAGGQVWPVREQNVIGVQVVGGSIGAQISASGDLSVTQRGAWATSITGDVLLRANPNTIIGQIGNTLGVNVIGGSIGARISASGDLNVREQAVLGVQVVGGGVNRVSISGDSLVVQQGGAWAISLSGDSTNPINTKPAPGQTWSVREQGVVGVQLVGGGTNRVSISGDQLVVTQGGAWSISLSGDSTNPINTKPASGQTWPVSQQGVIGVNIVGGAGHGTVGVSGDVQSKQSGAWAMAITGDVLLRANPGVIIGQIGNTVGVNVIGGSIGSQVSPSGDFPVRIGASTASFGVSGDVSTKPAAGQIWLVKEQNPIGVQIIGGSIGARVSASGDLNVIPSTTVFTPFPISGDTRLIDGTNQAIKATIKQFTRSNPLTVTLVNASGDVYNAGGGTSSGGDGAILDGSNSAIKATVKSYSNSNPLTVVLVNVSGDVYNAGGGAGAASNVNLNQVGGISTSVNAGTSDNGTQRVVIASDQGTLPVSFPGGVSTVPPVTGVQVVGGSIGGTVNVSGDIFVNQRGAWATAVTGDVSTLPKAGQVWPVREQGVVGVQVIGGGTNRVSVSGDQLAVIQQGAWATSITGDVLLRANPNVIIGQIGNTVGVNVIGGSIGARVSASGDLNVIPSTTNFNKFPISGDTRLIDGIDATIKASVKAYARSNPLAVVLVNVSGDAYNGSSDDPNVLTISGRVSGAGSTQIIAAVAGKRIKVMSYDLQGDSQAANARGFFASGASGSQLTIEWELAFREGVVKQMPPVDDAFIFGTNAGQALSFESSSTGPMKYAATYHADDAQ